MSRPRTPAHERELRARRFGDLVKQHMEQQQRRREIVSVTAAIDYVGGQLKIGLRTAFRRWAEYKAVAGETTLAAGGSAAVCFAGEAVRTPAGIFNGVLTGLLSKPARWWVRR
jgi:hypothetical protein